MTLDSVFPPPPRAPAFVAAAMDFLFDVAHARPRAIPVRGIAISPYADLASALTTMKVYGHKTLPVVDEEGRLIGELRREAAEAHFPHTNAPARRRAA